MCHRGGPGGTELIPRAAVTGLFWKAANKLYASPGRSMQPSLRVALLPIWIPLIFRSFEIQRIVSKCYRRFENKAGEALAPFPGITSKREGLQYLAPDSLNKNNVSSRQSFGLVLKEA